MAGQHQPGRRLTSPDPSGREESSVRSAKARRIRLACSRCQTRKIKCDNSVPQCSGCQKAGAACVDGKTVAQEGVVSRSEAASLREQIQRLEEALQSRERSTQPANFGNDHNTFLQQDRQPSVAVKRTDGQIQEDQYVSNSPVPNDISRNTQIQTHPRDSNQVAHEIGLIPLSAGINKYVGPSSGFQFAKLLFARADQAGLSPQSTSGSNHRGSAGLTSTTKSRSAFIIPPSSLPSSIEQALQLSRVYFEHIHFQYPFLHEPSYDHMVYQVYQLPETGPTIRRFQVTMVLAISAIILAKRVRIPFSGEGLCAAAMEHVDKIDLHNSIPGVQCLLLIAIFTLHSSYLSINLWYINYQCLAIVLDQGLQRDVPMSNAVSAFEKEMRTRIFWVIYSLDRTLATTLGRPIGLRDEACDLRLPLGLEDKDLQASTGNVCGGERSAREPNPMAYSIVFFKLAQLNSEIKYILHSVTRNTPKYTYPQITDIQAWQTDVWQRLQAVYNSMPSPRDEDKYLFNLSQIRYQEITMLLFRPTPRLRTPTKESLNHCHRSAKSTIELWKELYETDRLSFSWITIHSVCMSAITLLYCVWMAPEIAATTQIDALTSIMRNCSNLLSAAGEYWVEARRSRGSLDDLTMATIRWLLDTQTRTAKGSSLSLRRDNTHTSDVAHGMTVTDSGIFGRQDDTMYTSSQLPEFNDTALDFSGLDTYINCEDLAAFVGAPDPFTNNFMETMEGMFSEYQPLFEFGAPTDMETSFLS